MCVVCLPFGATDFLLAGSQFFDFGVRMEINRWQTDGQRSSVAHHLMAETWTNQDNQTIS